MRLLSLFLGVAVLCPAAAQAQAPVSLGGSSSVRAADDFATRAFQDPWDMSQRTDLGPLLGSADQPASGFTNISFASGVFAGTTTASDANLWLLDTGNPNAAPIGRIGTNYPIDAATYQILALRMSVQTPAQMFVYAWQNTIYNSSPTLIASPATAAGSRIYLVNLAASASWTGLKRALRLDPAEGRTNEAVQLDWARLVSVDSSLCRTITWTGGGAVDIYLDTDTAPGSNLGPIALTANAGQASPGCSAVGGAYNFYAGALPAGTYKVFAVTAGTPVTTTSAKYASGSWVVNTIPTLTFTSPSEEGSDDDFATTQLGNAWDMNAVTDVDFLSGVNSPQITSLDLEAPDGTPLPAQRVFYGTSAAGTAPCPATSGTVGDPIVELLENNKRGKTRQIDADRYRLLTVEFGLPAKARDVNCGSIARVVWRAKGDLGPGSVSDDIIFTSRAGANVLDKFTVDMKSLLVEQGTGAGGPNWTNGPGGGIDIFRFDPHEFTPATPFFIRRVKLATFEQAKTSYTIRWTYSGGPGTVELYYTTVANDFNSGTLITVVSAAAGQYAWSIPGNLPTSPATPYYLYAKVSDGINVNQVYAAQPIVLDSTYVPRPRMVLNRSVLNFGITGGTVTSGAQTVRVTFAGAGAPPCWTASSSNGNFAIANPTGTGNGSFTVSLVPQVFPGAGTGQGTITVTECTPNTILNPGQQVTATYRIASQGAAPVGAVDTPLEGAVVSGSIAVTGWAVDDIDLASVKIYRDAVAGETGDGLGRIFVGDAVRVDDARADIEAAFATIPRNYRGGWGYLMLTNFLPSGGNGTFILRAYATDRDGHEAFLGARTIVASNSSATRPFGAIDTPGQGETIAGTAYNNFGWVLARGPAMATPVFGGTVSVVIDGVAVGAPGSWGNRSDLDALFPAATYPGITKALGVFTFDTTVYAEGLHTIAWAVTTNDGQSDGIGSRYFSVANATSGSSTAAGLRAPGALSSSGSQFSGPDLGRDAAEAGAVDRLAGVASRHGFDGTPVAAPAGASGRRLVLGRQMERVIVDASAAGASSYQAYRSVGGRLEPLPAGASFDAARGILYWQPGVGYTGDYDFEIVASGRRIPVRVVLQPQRTGPRAARGWIFSFRGTA